MINVAKQVICAIIKVEKESFNAQKSPSPAKDLGDFLVVRTDVVYLCFLSLRCSNQYL